MGACVALVVAAGRGRRFGGERPKQYLALGGRPIIRRAVECFLTHPRVDDVLAVIHPDDRALFARATEGLDLLAPVAGGDSRQDSVRLGLESLAGRPPERVLIHDAARPFAEAAMISRVLDALETAPGAIPALPVGDTLKRGQDGLVTGTVERQGLWRAQTPQGFRYADIARAHGGLAGTALTDDAAVAEKAGLPVRLVPGSEDNLKITTDDDLARARRLIGGETRTGFGFDAHRFGPGDHVMLCGVSIPHSAGLAGHSDADAGLHALTDALLGAIGAGDLGLHFPSTGAEWKDAQSDILLRKAADLIAGRGGAVANIDVTIVCEAPRIGPHRDAMRRRIADILGLDAGRVSVKATTTDGLGFTGRGEGIAAQAVATVHLPPET
ncbi:MAG: bifunctional 2-C-methyl-D-erythritol 4-phosphate cytidylyltransferase/2-C-methyl-D-erythritol 2,4-cyclodiphosphate synthase [Proteobacteria bacterium]|nr:bifunctional 2-C-methyl-D-erythritol 4-phosphate cytidylyltransferase/2-C-methyl-D-erythritol 2,4-cyclodiphosphate synthase [Pseudomonadota bacterium]